MLLRATDLAPMIPTTIRIWSNTTEKNCAPKFFIFYLVHFYFYHVSNSLRFKDTHFHNNPQIVYGFSISLNLDPLRHYWDFKCPYSLRATNLELFFHSFVGNDQFPLAGSQKSWENWVRTHDLAITWQLHHSRY